MFKYLASFISLIVFVSCQSTSEDSHDDDSGDEDSDSLLIVDFPVDFKSDIRPDQQEWFLNKIYTDTLLFLEFDSDYDYWYGYFENSDGKEFTMVYDSIIEPAFNNSILLVEWEIDSMWDVGDDDALYYDERMLSYRVLEKV